MIAPANSLQSAPGLHPQQDHGAVVQRLVDLLDLETLEVDLFRGQSQDSGWQRVYGGQVVAQALMAASRTVRPERLAHSLHAYFLRPGDPHAPIVYRVERDRDGQSFSTRRVVAIQHGRPIFNLSASFQIEELGFTHASRMPQVADPETLPSELEVFERNAATLTPAQRYLWLKRERAFEFRMVESIDWASPQRQPPVSHHWFRSAAPLPTDPVLARCLLAYASDMTLLDTCLLPHGIAWNDPSLQVASIDHALWFNATPDLSGWLLSAQESPASGNGRGLNRGLIFAQDGRLVATSMQEALIRHRS